MFTNSSINSPSTDFENEVPPLAQGPSTHGWAELATLTPPAEPVVMGMVRSLSISCGLKRKATDEEKEAKPQSNLNSTYPSTRLIARKSPLPASSLYSSVPSGINGRNVSSNSMKDR
ncbi:hypothetical protein EYF80_009137 [Liparis tanakae]|uniref:Uncharacterized protein n=1 Tax=Liparis tanakae TaxID=230148 RepID=A0A4Z2IRK5_9TELE|nr:hypothetical protein EYF80_009137 [Liparis tanakae]